VFGPREVRWKDGRPRIPEAEPVTEVAMSRELAYGGLDWRSTRLVEGTELEVLAQIQYDHPGMYPRNPHGRGYLVDPTEVPDFFMPQLERPDDLLSEDRLIVDDPSRWYDQPLPWFLGWAHPSAFPQLVYFGPGADAWYPGPQDESMPEVAQGFLPKKYRSIMELRQLSDGPDLRYRQGASYGMSFDDLAGAPISVSGMHPELRSQSFKIPQEFPEFRFTLDGEETVVTPRLHSVVIRPADERVTLLFGAEALLPRLFIPGVHAEIPVAVQIDGAERLAYKAPPTMKNIIEQGGS
jgi:hypothetical protein